MLDTRDIRQQGCGHETLVRPCCNRRPVIAWQVILECAVQNCALHSCTQREYRTLGGGHPGKRRYDTHSTQQPVRHLCGRPRCRLRKRASSSAPAAAGARRHSSKLLSTCGHVVVRGAGSRQAGGACEGRSWGASLRSRPLLAGRLSSLQCRDVRPAGHTHPTVQASSSLNPRTHLSLQVAAIAHRAEPRATAGRGRSEGRRGWRQRTSWHKLLGRHATRPTACRLLCAKLRPVSRRSRPSPTTTSPHTHTHPHLPHRSATAPTLNPAPLPPRPPTR